MVHLFLYHNGTRGCVMLCRALYQAVVVSGHFDVTLACCRGDLELLADLQGPRCRVLVSDYRNTALGAPLNLLALCPNGAVPIEVGLGGEETVPTCQWPDIVDSFHRELRRRGLVQVVADPEGEVPMFGFAGEVVVPPLRRRSIYVDNTRTGQDAGWFHYDLLRLSRALPGWDLLCTRRPPVLAPNLVDISALRWPQRSRVSEQCEALVGTTLDPFVVTLTEANRWRPKALCGHDARVTKPFWDYPGNPLELLATMDELVDFLLANVAEVAQ